MKIASIGSIALLFVGAISAYADSLGKPYPHIADAASACLVNCASQNDSCKRMCPATYNGPCMSACDNQAQFCRQSCQQK
jgi:hypothetical protein